ncbi:hypothetical protein NUW58_g6450 [Xylaria curta]|uniref:Uncharacterized protein n=1 Tax=Xylaria curta TaxID=42375 RepID=A0ACC1NUC0_9PEZI|nr:hypothetical protein NUW58_g6450 [Xylaria curta]
MQASNPPSQRTMQRRSPGPDGPPSNVPTRSMSPANVQPRSSTASNRSAGGSGGGEKSVTHLLVATKQLLETLTQWSRGAATDTQVSDVYVRLGYEFNMACRAFTAINVDTSDLGNVPESLRHILEATLSQEASTESLEKYLPRIRDIIINLLHGLKRKQQKLRQRQSKEKETGSPEDNSIASRTISTSTVGSNGTGLTNLLNEGIENGYDSAAQRDSGRASTNGVPMLPTQTTPVPNRGRAEVRESMRAVQVREPMRHSRNTSSQSKSAFESSPVRIPSQISEESSGVDFPPPQEASPTQSPTEKYRPSATISGPLQDTFATTGPDSPEEVKPKVDLLRESKQRPETPSNKEQREFTQEQSPPLEKELTLFLQYKSKVKKFVLPEGYTDLTIGRLQLAFIEKFSWNTALNGADLPEIYIQDPISGVRHELEDLSDVKDRTVLALNIEPLDEVKRHIDDGLGTLKKTMDEVRQNVTDQAAALQQVSDRQLETAKEMARMAAAPPVALDVTRNSGGPGLGAKLNPSQLRELQSLRRDLAILRQTYSNFQTEIQSSMSSLRSKAANVKVAAIKASVPHVEGDSGYAYVMSGRKQLNSDSDRLVNKVDDLQDLVEDLRKDVVNRGVRPLPRQLESVSKDIQLLTKELKKMDDYMKREKPVWTKIWEKELEEVCQGRDELKLMEDLMIDLKDDLEKATETFTLVEQATKEQMKENTPAARQFSRGLQNLGNSTDQSAAKEGVLGEVRALQPNHEDRLEAIERAEKLRQKELESRKDNPMKKELANFVEEGKLKKSGGFEEVERARNAKDDRIRKEVWERMNGIIPENPIGEEANGNDAPAEAENEGDVQP